MEMTRESAVQIIESREQITTDGSYLLKCNNVHPFEGKFIANFNAMTPYLVEKAITLLDQDEFQAATNTSLSASLRPVDYIPLKGEIVKVFVKTLTTANGVTGLFVTNVSEAPVVKTGKVSLTKKAEESFSEITDTTMIPA